MAQMLILGKEIVRINPKNPARLEVSTNDGRSWTTRYSGTSCGDFQDLTDNGKEILATTSKGLFYSRNDGRSWSKRS
ncbi:MAG: hypothetical protein WBF83_03670 [Moheibacter sp.]